MLFGPLDGEVGEEETGSEIWRGKNRMTHERKFLDWFKRATESEPYPYQIRFACEATLPELVDVPTCLRATHRQAAMGKTAMAVLAWLWRELAGLHGHGLVLSECSLGAR